MPATTADAFNQFDDELKLDPAEHQDAIDLHHKIRDVLADKSVCLDAILQGSFARKTMNAPLRDIDMIGFLAAEHAGLKDRATGPDEAMDLVIGALRPALPGARFEKSRHAVQIEFPDREFTFDLVPAFDRDGSDLADIANRVTGSWDESNARQLIVAVQQRNQECSGKLVHQVRMVKHWGRDSLQEVPGLHLESATYHAVTKAMPHSKAVTMALEYLADALESGALQDPTGSENLLDRLDGDVIATTAAMARSAARKAREARDLEDAGEHQAAIDIWHRLFGDAFPSAEAQSVNDAFTRSLAGGITSTGRAAATSRAHTQSPPVRSWRRP